MALQTGSTSCLKLSKLQRRWSLLFAAAILALAMLACGFLGASSRSNSDRVAVVKRLPTLTRTPLPTLSPTLDPSSGQVTVLTTEPVLISPAPPPVLAPTFTPASNEAEALASNIPQADTGPMLTALVNLNVRTGPGTDYPILGKLTPGESIQIIGQNPEQTWWQIVYPPGSGSPGWVSGDTQYSTASSIEAVAAAQLPPPPPPTVTPTLAPAPVIQPTQPLALATDAPNALPSQTPISDGDSTAEPTATSVPGPPGWAFAGVRLYPDQGDETLLVYGNLINNTGSSQELWAITGDFYDAGGKIISDKDKTYAYWPVYVIPSGAEVPFEILVDDVDDGATDYNLDVEAQPSDDTPHQDFEFLEVNQWNEDEFYCLKGKVRNLGSELQDYLFIAAVLYDSQDQVIRFGDYQELGHIGLEGDKTSKFQICVDALNQAVARYELQAWGR